MLTLLYGGEITDYRDFEKEYFKKLSKFCSDGTISRLIKNYCGNFDAILGICEQEPSQAQVVPGMNDTIKAEIEFLLENEMVCKLSDLLLRRTDIGSFKTPRI